MKKLLTVLFIVIVFAAGSLSTYAYFYNKINCKPAAVNKIMLISNNEEKVVIDRTNFDTYSHTILEAINKCAKDEKRMDMKSEHDILTYLNVYHDESFYNNSNKYTKEQKRIIDDVWLSSLNYMYLLEAKEDNKTDEIKVQHKILDTLLSPYKLK